MSKQSRPTVRVFREGTHVIIESKLVLRDLVPATNRKTLVTIAGEQFYVADHRASADTSHFLYRLSPWVPGREIPGRRLFYESADDFAAEAESQLKQGPTLIARLLYIIVFPMIGFLPIAWKESLERRFGCSVHRHTFVSICAEVAVGLAAVTVLAISNLAATMLAVMYGAELSGSARLVNPNLMLAVTAVCFVDAALRFHHYMEGRYFGLYEWLLRRRTR